MQAFLSFSPSLILNLKLKRNYPFENPVPLLLLLRSRGDLQLDLGQGDARGRVHPLPQVLPRQGGGDLGAEGLDEHAARRDAVDAAGPGSVVGFFFF